jgi:hypothetical protein
LLTTSALVVREQGVMRRDAAAVGAVEHAEVVLGAVGMAAAAHREADVRPLHGDVARALVQVQVLVHAVRDVDVIEHDQPVRRHLHRVVLRRGPFGIGHRRADAQVPDHDVAERGRVVGVQMPEQGDAGARRGLPGDGEVAVRDVQVAADRARDREHYDARTGRVHRGLQAAGSARIEIGDAQHRTAAAAAGTRPESLGTGKCRLRRRRKRQGAQHEQDGGLPSRSRGGGFCSCTHRLDSLVRVWCRRPPRSGADGGIPAPTWERPGT